MLRTDFKDDVLDLTQNQKRKFTQVTNADGTISFDDETVYSQTGDLFGAAEINDTNAFANNNYLSMVGTIFKINTGGWTLNGATNLYEYTINASAVYSPTPDFALSGETVGAQVTSAEESAYKCVTSAGHYAETSDNTVHLFAKSAPASDFYVMIKGVA